MHKFNVGDHIRPKNSEFHGLGYHGTIIETDYNGYTVQWQRYDNPWPQSLEFIHEDYELISTEKAPAHYVEGRTIEPRSVVKDWELNFNLGNVLKYISRVGRKGEDIEDLRKAITYLEFEIEDREGNG